MYLRDRETRGIVGLRNILTEFGAFESWIVSEVLGTLEQKTCGTCCSVRGMSQTTSPLKVRGATGSSHC